VLILIEKSPRETLTAIGLRKITDQAGSAESRENRGSPIVEKNRCRCHRAVGDTDSMEFPDRFDQWDKDADGLPSLQTVTDGQ